MGDEKRRTRVRQTINGRFDNDPYGAQKLDFAVDWIIKLQGALREMKPYVPEHFWKKWFSECDTDPDYGLTDEDSPAR